MARGGTTKNRALKKPDKLNLDHFMPGIAAGLTEGLTDQESLEVHPVSTAPSGLELARLMKDIEKVAGKRVPRPKFIVEDANTDLVTNLGDDRYFRDSRRIYPEPVMAAMREGMMCMRCHEPQEYPFEDAHLEGCEGVSLAGPHYMRDLQIKDIIREFEGSVHVGPSKPISEFLAKQEERVQKRRFIVKVLEGGSGRVPKEWLQDKDLFPHGPPPRLL